jgi:hypothetical protein
LLKVLTPFEAGFFNYKLSHLLYNKRIVFVVSIV